MINLRNLKSLKEKGADVDLQFVIDYILNKTQRDLSEFESYSNEEDWIELDHYLQGLDEPRRRKSFTRLKRLLNKYNEDELYSTETSFEKTLLRHLTRV